MARLRIYPGTQPYDAIYDSLVDSIPAGNQWHKGPVVLPYSEVKPFTFTLEGSEGDVVQIFVNNVLITTVVASGFSQSINIPLQLGKNFILAKTSGESWLLLVVAANYATLLRGYASDYYFNVDAKFENVSNQLNSELSLRHTEHQLDFPDLLPPTRALRILAGKIAVRSLINETGSTRGVDDIVTAVTHTTPLVRETKVNLDVYEPSVYTVYSKAHDFGGFEFHVWIPNLCVGTWVSFITLLDNLDDGIAKLTSVSDEKVSLLWLGNPESHTFDFGSPLCSLTTLLTQDCLPLVVSPILTSQSEVAFCAWQYPFDVVTDLALGIERLDSTEPVSEVILAANIQTDVTGSLTGIIGAAFVEVSRPPEQIIVVTSIDPIGAAILPAFRVPGTFRVVLASGNPGRDVNVRYYASLPFDFGVDLDSAEESDPLTDGWYGTPIPGRFDGDTCLDTMVSSTSLFDDLECCFTEPRVTLLTSSLTEITLNLPISAGASLVITP